MAQHKNTNSKHCDFFFLQLWVCVQEYVQVHVEAKGQTGVSSLLTLHHIIFYETGSYFHHTYLLIELHWLASQGVHLTLPSQHWD